MGGGGLGVLLSIRVVVAKDRACTTEREAALARKAKKDAILFA